MFPLQDSTRAHTTPFVTWAIIGLNCMMFIVELSIPHNELNYFVEQLGVVPLRFNTQLDWIEMTSIFSAMFLHGSWLHLISNMWALYIFGDNVEDRMGHWRFLIFYLLGGFLATMLEVWLHPFSLLPIVGASGAIASILGAYIVLFPQARIITWIPIFFIPYFVEIPAAVYLGVWFFTQFVSGVGSVVSVDPQSGGVAFWAHVGGFVAGALMVKLFEKKKQVHFYPDDYWPF